MANRSTPSTWRAQLPRAKTASQARKNKLFILDTNVLMHDPTSLLQFEEHDIFLPMGVLEELDKHKKGASEVAANTRAASRKIDELLVLAKKTGESWQNGLPLSLLGDQNAKGRLFLPVIPRSALRESRAGDHNIILDALEFEKAHKYKEIIFVSKDINARIKALTIGLTPEDYLHDFAVRDSDHLYDSIQELEARYVYTQITDENADGETPSYKIDLPRGMTLLPNQFVVARDMPDRIVREVDVDARIAILQNCRNFIKKHHVLNIRARNARQNFACNLLVDPNIHLVSLVGCAGSGKTLLALASGLAQTIGEGRYKQVLFTRITVPIGDEIGFLPGDENDKMRPWLGALEDNLEIIAGENPSDEAPRTALSDQLRKVVRKTEEPSRPFSIEMLKNYIKSPSLTFFRGRTFHQRFVIIDEAQNLTPKQMKTIITRAGPGTKYVLTGNLGQIDTPYLSEGSSGLSYLVNRFRGWPHYGHVILEKVERSPLADYAENTL